jgi:hypothetical protein
MPLPAPSSLRRYAAVGLAAVAAAAALGACAGERALGIGDVRAVTIVLGDDTLRPGQQRLAQAIATGRNGEVVDASITWRSLTPTTLAVSRDGQVFALAPGIGILRATAGTATADRRLTLVNPPVARFLVEPDSLLFQLPGLPQTPTIVPLDSAGTPVVGVTLRFESDAARIATVSAAGLVTPLAAGRTTLRVSAEGIARDLPVRVEPADLPLAPQLDAIEPATLSVGVPFTVRGARLAVPGAQPSVAVDGRAAQVLTASDTLVTAVLLPSAAACEPTGAVLAQVATANGVGARAVRLELAPRRTLGVGEAALALTSADAACLELLADGRYLVQVVNAGRALGAGAVGVQVDVRAGLGSPTAFRLGADAGMAPNLLPTAPDAHTDLLERSRAWHPPAIARRVATLQLPPAGGLVGVRVPDLDDPRLCIGFRPITARAVYVGSRIAILEDTAQASGGAPTLAGQMDALIAEIGAEVETRIWPLIERFGNPLVMDDRLDANGRVILVLTPVMNTMRAGTVMGAVVSCDFFPRASTPASNVGEMLYLQVPDLLTHPDAAEARAAWRAEVRGTIAHELKHVVGFAERIVRGQVLEEPWLEEATARHGEELFTRSLQGIPAGSDAGYASLRCEALASLGDAGCAGTPVLMRRTLDGLYRFLAAPAQRTPLGPAVSGDDSFYGSGWSLLRWAMDHTAVDDAVFVRALTVSGQSGVGNLEARSGRSWDDLLLRWSLAVASDGRAGVATPTDATLTFRAWNLGDLFAGYCGDLGGCGGGSAEGTFGLAHPLQPLAITADATVDVAEIAPAGFVSLELAPTGTGASRLIRLRGRNGAGVPLPLRLAVLRVE